MTAKKRARVERVSPLTQEVLQQFAELLLAGNYLDVAATSLGISISDAKNWLYMGRKEFERRGNGGIPDDQKEPYYHFYMAVSMGMAGAETQAVGALHRAGQRDWRASIAFLERRFPKRWGKALNVLIEEKINGLLDRLQSRLPEPEFRKVLECLLEESSYLPAAEVESEDL